jgi:Protein of unknown function (DUF3800)
MDYRIFCDESCHLERDGHQAMVLGALWCPSQLVAMTRHDLRAIRADYHLADDFEIKWGKVSPAKVGFYLAVLDYFFARDDLHFRALIVPDKNRLDHERFGQGHDSFYYKMCFDLLKVILEPPSTYEVYLDIKDTQSADKVRTLRDVISRKVHDFDGRVVRHIQNVRSEEVQEIQLADLLVGAVSSANRSQAGSAKGACIEFIRQRCGHDLTLTTALADRKFNLLRWQAS